jgi:hypothetical protein
MGHAIDRFLKLGRIPSLGRHGLKHCHGLGVAIAFVLVPMAEAICEGFHGNLRSQVRMARRYSQKLE